ncbi:bifunctional non-homologous end joining protein LigD [Paenibacillus cellulosilyticus]|uniref:DNA ligase (ATP) n=1 Tax=Paenibacillus cellulosilyticus TaxID=375489 RepID=A0A2V2YL21_9BACL|nr:RNA ligase family protein [Paenibacillus cellulosilyticus]PWV93780.1 bifunctional non-homologous end joining protein LigD [Paenibacillus cellulosilyticus]QKS47400.1 DNA ligase [Paenibacillus cellulosilyticus]
MTKKRAWYVDQPIEPFEPVTADRLPDGGDWLYQIKWDGVRMLVYADGDRCELFNRHGNRRTDLYPELLDWRSYCKAQSVLLDGEIIALGPDGKPSFHEVMRRDGIRRLDRVQQASRDVAITYMVFDLLFCDGQWWMEKPLAERQHKLNELIAQSGLVQVVPSYSDGALLLEVTKTQKLEGIVAKKADSIYSLGCKDNRWLKIKHWGDAIAVIGGYTTNGGIVNALVAGVYDDAGKLHFIGKVGTGRLKRSEWAALADVFAPIRRDTCPFAQRHRDMAGAVWVEPLLSMRLSYAEWRWQEGRQLRQPMIEALLPAPLTELPRFPHPE